MGGARGPVRPGWLRSPAWPHSAGECRHSSRLLSTHAGWGAATESTYVRMRIMARLKWKRKRKVKCSDDT